MSDKPIVEPHFVRSVVIVASLAALLSVRVLAQTPLSTQATEAPAVPADAEDVINPDRPGIADGSTVVGTGRVQIETGFQQEFRNSAGRTEHTHFLPSLLRVGIGSRWEARVEGNTLTQVSSSAGDQISDFAPISFGVKFHMQDGEGFRKPSLGTIVRVFPASGSGSLHTNEPTGDVRFVADCDLTPKLSINPNAGVAAYEDDTGQRFVAGLFAVTLNYFNAAKTLNPFVDFALQAPEGSNLGSSVILDAGIAYIWGRNVQIDSSVGVGPHGSTPPHRFVALGLSIRFRASPKRT